MSVGLHTYCTFSIAQYVKVLHGIETPIATDESSQSRMARFLQSVFSLCMTLREPRQHYTALYSVQCSEGS